MRLVIIIAALALSACATKPTRFVAISDKAPPFEEARAACEYQAELATPGQNLGGSIAQEVSRLVRKSELGVLCMRTKGYALEPQS